VSGQLQIKFAIGQIIGIRRAHYRIQQAEGWYDLQLAERHEPAPSLENARLGLAFARREKVGHGDSPVRSGGAPFGFARLDERDDPVGR